MAWSSLKYLPGQIGLALVVFGIWEGLVQADVLSAHIYGYPSGIAAKVWGLLSTGELFRHAAVTAFCRVALKGGHPQFVCHGLTELHRLKGSGRGIEKALGAHQQRAGG
jgi:hypothetical protein